MGLPEDVAAATEALSRETLSALIPQHQNIMYLEHNSTVGMALQLLARRHILSAPLVVLPGLEDMAQPEDGGEGASAPQLIGWVTVESILRAFLSHMEEKHGKLPRNMLLLMTQLEKEGPAFAEKPLITVSGSEDRGLLFQVHSDVSLLTALRESFVPPGKPAAHRLAVFDASGDITAVISQLDVIRHLRQHPELLGPLAHATMQQLGWAPAPGASPRRPLVTVEATLPALLAFERMTRAGVSGAPVVADAEGAGSGGGGGGMIANLSMSDLRNIQSQHLGILALPVGEFLALLHNTSYLGYSQRTSAQAEHPFFAAGPPTVLPPSPRCPPSPRLTAGIGSSQRLSSGGTVAGQSLRRVSGSGTNSGGGGGSRPPSVQGVAAMEVGGMGGEAGEEEEEAGPAWGIRMITCPPEATLLEVLAVLSDNKVHRVYVVTPAGTASGPAASGGSPPSGGSPRGGTSPSGLVRPVGVITPTDILRLLAAGRK